MKRFRKLWIALGALGVLVVVALIALPLLVDVNRYRGLIESRAEQALGREVGLGEMKLSLFPPGVQVDDVTIGSLPGEGPGDLLTVDHVRVGARLMPLLGKRLEVSGIVVDGPNMTLERGADGTWNVQRLFAAEADGAPAQGDADAGTSFLVESLSLTGGRITVRDAHADDPWEIVLSDLDLRLGDVALDRPLDIDLSAALAAGDDAGGRLAVQGSVGPFVAGEATTPLDLELRLEDVPGTLLERLTGFLAIDAHVQRATLAIDLAGKLPETFDAGGALTLDGVELPIAAADGSVRNAAVDVELRYDLGVSEGGRSLQIRALELGVWDSALKLSGRVSQDGELRRVDIELAPSTIPADDLAALAVLLFGELPLSFSSDSPIELTATVRGPVGSGVSPDVSGVIRLADFTVGLTGMSAPIEQLNAIVDLRGQRVEISGLTGVIGSSDLAGSAVLEGFDSPAIRFDLVSRQADFGELAAFLQSEERSAENAVESEAGPGSGGMTVDGTLRVERGTLETLDFSGLEATMAWAGDVLTLDPLSTRLYDGTFAGRVVTDLAGEEPAFEVRGDAVNVDLDAFLTDNLESPSLLAGRFTGRVETAGTGADFESIVLSLRGAGVVDVREGQVRGLDVLERLAGVSGLFGEETLQGLSGKLAQQGTAFDQFASAVRLENGLMLLDGLVLDSPDFKIEGDSSVDLLKSLLDGEFRLTLSKAISNSMRAEGSKAGQLFWNSKTRRVELPFTLSGPFEEPSVGLDFQAVARKAVENRAEEQVRGLLSDKLGVDLGGEDDGSSAAAVVAQQSTDDTVRVTGAEWTGNLLRRDLRITGELKTQNVLKAVVIVTDPDGTEVDRARIEDIDGAKDKTLSWTVKIDGKKLAAASMPVTVRVRINRTDGSRSESTLQVDR